MVSPTTAPLTAATMAPPRLMGWWKASTPPSSTAISPGKTKPTNADDSSAGKANTTVSADHPFRLKMADGMSGTS
jgi:hypothetical protein